VGRKEELGGDSVVPFSHSALKRRRADVFSSVSPPYRTIGML
jgi:hypothetical protein